MTPEAVGYVVGAAGDEATARANRAGFDHWRIVPRMMRGVTARDLSTTRARAPRCRRRCCWPRSA